MPHLSLHPKLKTCSADTILRAIKELTTDNITSVSYTHLDVYKRQIWHRHGYM